MAMARGCFPGPFSGFYRYWTCIFYQGRSFFILYELGNPDINYDLCVGVCMFFVCDQGCAFPAMGKGQVSEYLLRDLRWLSSHYDAAASKWHARQRRFDGIQ